MSQMEKQTTFLDQVALLVTHYNRSSSLERLLESFKQQKIEFKEIIISDDGSHLDHLTRVRRLRDKFNFKFVESDKNRGLANNINKGQRAVSASYTLYVQEDFVPADQFIDRLKDGLKLIEKDPTIDLVRFYAYHKHPYLKPLKDGFAEMKFFFWRPNFWQFFCYSDHPHLRRSSFPAKFGDYKEGISSDRAEFLMAISFLKNKGKALIHKDYSHIFFQKNDQLEPSQISRKKIRKYMQLTDSFLIRMLRTIYRNIKFRLDYLFLK
ncbi:MAG: glycosyltransferase family A protein [Prolixibacteraceae bacterium]